MSPTLSILIPVYKRDCRRLLEELYKQAEELSVGYEIILGDDCSGEPYTSQYIAYEQEGLCRLVSAEENMGAGRLRNRLAEEAQGEQLLILDSDTLPASSDFIERYLRHASGTTVVCGGFVYPPKSTNPLRQRYGAEVESRSAEERARKPHSGFISMAFMIPRKQMLATGFPPNMGMGYEDILFGERLRQAGIPILHIDNPVEHYHCDTAEGFLATTRSYLDNLYCHREELAELVSLLRAYDLLKRLHLMRMVAALWPLIRSSLEKQLTGAKPSLLLFSLYKLLYVASLSLACVKKADP